jgi:hypothetical protein
MLGVTGGHLGQSVAIDRGLAVAGEPGFNAHRGRIRTWKMSGSVATAQPHYAPAGLASADRYGVRVAVQSNGCEFPACTSFADVVVSRDLTRIHVARRAWGGWQASQTINPPAGAEFLWPGSLDVSHYQVLATLNIMSASPQTGCQVGRAVRVFYRSGGNFNTLGDACPPPSGASASFGTAVAADRGTTGFYASSPDFSEQQVGSVATFAGHPGIGYIDSVQELSLAPTGTGLALNDFTDSFGTSISAHSTYMAVGAPWRQPHIGSVGIGYVAIYVTCC